MKLNRILLALAMAVASVAHAQPAQSGEQAALAEPRQANGAQELLSEGEVRKINREAGKVTLRHGPLANLDMPAMTMVFTVKDPAMLDQVKPGDKVQFHAENASGAIVVTHIQKGS